MPTKSNHKTSIKFDPDNWEKLSYLAALNKTSPTKIINHLVDCYVNEKLPDEYEQRIEQRVNEQLEGKIEESLLNTLASLIAHKLGLNHDDTSTTCATLEGSTTDNEHSIQPSQGAQLTIDTKATEATDTTKSDTIGKESKKNANLAKFRKYKASENRRSYDDKYVATAEGLNQTTVNRYRKGNRSPKQDFIDRWGLNWDGTRWIKNEV